MIIGIHQPNYLPWLGYFNKIAQSDVFIFLDDVQFSKNGYCNRVRILRGGELAWLTVPVSYSFGDAIGRVAAAQPDWANRHLDALKSAYSNSPSFYEVWGHIEEMYRSIPDGDLAETNRYLVEAFASKLGLACKFAQSSEMETGDARGDDRLVALMRSLPGAKVYFSGRGGAEYQDEVKFSDAGFELAYTGFASPVYPQSETPFTPGLSVVDAVFNVGWDETRNLIAG